MEEVPVQANTFIPIFCFRFALKPQYFLIKKFLLPVQANTFLFQKILNPIFFGIKV